VTEKRTKSGEFPSGTMTAGRIYSTSDPAPIPARTELTVLAADPKTSAKIGWTVREYNGGAVSRIDDKNEIVESPIKGKNALKEGDRLVAPTLVGEVQAVVGRDEVGDLCWVSGGYVGDLEYDKKRGYWITSVAINKKLLT
jgi:hypothetical protein